MASTSCDQKKAEIVRLFQRQCIAETGKVKAIYDLQCLQVKENYKLKMQQACHDLRDQELKELAEQKRIHNAMMGPINAKHAEEFAEMQQKYGIISPEADMLAPDLLEAPKSPDLAVAPKAQPVQNNSASGSNSLEDSQESSDESDTSIPAVIPKTTTKATTQATTQAMFAPPLNKRKRRLSTEIGGHDEEDDDDESNYSQSEIEDQRDDLSDNTFQDSPLRPPRKAKVSKASKRPPASSAPTRTMKNGLDQDADESTHSLSGISGLIEPSPVFSPTQEQQQTC